MNENGKELYEKIKKRVESSQEEGTLEKQFGDFWKFACTIKARQHDLKYLYMIQVENSWIKIVKT